MKITVQPSKLLGLLLLVTSIAFAQSPSDTLTKKELRQQKKAAKIKSGKLLISPLAGPAYTPELKFTLGAGGILSWRNSKTNEELPRSSMPVMMAFSSTGATTLSLRPSTYWNDDKLRITGDYWFKAMPDNYWGIGYEKAYNTKISDSTTEYFRKWFQIRTDVLFKVKENIFVGAYTDVNYTQGKDEAALILTDENYLFYNDRPFNFGFGPEFTYDSRDVPVNAYKGMYINAIAAFYNSSWGSDNTYQMYLVDYRQYKSVGQRAGRVIAWQMKGRFTVGEVPYGEMSQLGTPMDLRGYTWGRYRDKSMFYFLAEYRHKFYKANGEASRSGMVGWIGSGTIFDFEKNSDYNNQALWLPSYGVGYRLEVQPRMNVRLDIGIGRETSGFYFNFQEAF